MFSFSVVFVFDKLNSWKFVAGFEEVCGNLLTYVNIFLFSSLALKLNYSYESSLIVPLWLSVSLNLLLSSVANLGDLGLVFDFF